MGKNSGFSAATVFMAFLLGGAVGAGLALLLAPQSGEETRKKLRGVAEDVKEKASQFTEQIKDKIVSTVEEGKGIIEEKSSLISTAIQAGKEAMEKERERLSKEKGT